MVTHRPPPIPETAFAAWRRTAAVAGQMADLTAHKAPESDRMGEWKDIPWEGVECLAVVLREEVKKGEAASHEWAAAGICF